MDEYCPHCGARLPYDRTDYCIECRADLSKRPPSSDNPAASPLPAERVASDQQKAVVEAVVVSIACYAILIGMLFIPMVRAKAVEAFGQEPLGLPAVVFAGVLLTVLFLPMPRAFYHFSLIMKQARQDGRLLFGQDCLLYVAKVHHRYPHLARSRRICLGSLAYCAVILAAWLAYTVILGI